MEEVHNLIDLGASDGEKITFEDFYFVMTNQKLKRKGKHEKTGPIVTEELMI
jgi:hypothetical protein